MQRAARRRGARCLSTAATPVNRRSADQVKAKQPPLQITQRNRQTSQQHRQSTPQKALNTTEGDIRTLFQPTPSRSRGPDLDPPNGQKLLPSTWRPAGTRARNPLPGAINTPTFELPPSAERLSSMKRFEETSKPFSTLGSGPRFLQPRFRRRGRGVYAPPTVGASPVCGFCADFVMKRSWPACGAPPQAPSI